jgi:hypothetical protein
VIVSSCQNLASDATTMLGDLVGEGRLDRSTIYMSTYQGADIWCKSPCLFASFHNLLPTHLHPFVSKGAGREVLACLCLSEVLEPQATVRSLRTGVFSEMVSNSVD